MTSLQQFFSSKTRTKISLATSTCLLAFVFLYEVWKSGTAYAVIDHGSKLAEQAQSNHLQHANGFIQDTDAIESLVFATTTDEADTTTLRSSTSTQAAETTTMPQDSKAPRRPALIAGAVDTNTLDWMQALGYDIHAFSVTDPESVPANKGREAMVYLTYLITNYDSLPPYAIFIHGHKHAWHQDKDMTTMIRNLQIPALQEEHYVSLRCSWSPSCPAELRPIAHDAIVWGDGINVRDTEDAIGDAWAQLFPERDLPATIASQCCAQFAVPRDAMLRWRKEDYVRMREWILRTELEDAVSGRVFEKLWAYIFLGEAVHCPAPQACSCKYFNDCEPHRWPVPPEGLGPLPGEKWI